MDTFNYLTEQIVAASGDHTKEGFPTAFSIITDEVRNCRTLTSVELLCIKYLSDEEKYELILLYNKMLTHVLKLL